MNSPIVTRLRQSCEVWALERRRALTRQVERCFTIQTSDRSTGGSGSCPSIGQAQSRSDVSPALTSGDVTAMSTSESRHSTSDVRVDHAVLGCTDARVTAYLFEAYGFVIDAERTLSVEAADALYGLEHAATELVLGVEGAASGGLRLVETHLPEPEFDAYARGGHALDLYTTDMDASVAVGRAAGAKVSIIADFTFGPVHLRQSMATGPDGVMIVFVEIAHRLPSVLDSQPDRLHSQLHSIVQVVEDLDAATAWWTDVVGLNLRNRFPISEPAVAEFMGLPRPTPLTMSVLTDADVSAPRYELMAYDGEPGGYHGTRPLRPGGVRPVMTVIDLGSTMDRLIGGGADAGAVVDALSIAGQSQRAVVLTGPGGLDVELRERR